MFFGRPALKLQYASNLFHRRAAPAMKFIEPTGVPYLALLGNCVTVGDCPKDFLQHCSDNWDKTFIVPGPYEIAAATKEFKKENLYTAITDRLRNLTNSYPNIYLLDQAEISLRLEGIRILGLQGWAGDADTIMTPGVYEFDNIVSAKGGVLQPITETDIAELSHSDSEWLAERLDRGDGTPTVILSHTLPSPYLLQRGLHPSAYRRMDLDLFPTGYAQQLLQPDVVGWLSGATGSCVSGTFNKTYMAVNSRVPLRTEAVNPNFQVNQVFTWKRSGPFPPAMSPGSARRLPAYNPQLL